MEVPWEVKYNPWHEMIRLADPNDLVYEKEPTMTPEEVQAKVEEIRQVAETRDYEKAHNVEDGLLVRVLGEIANGADNAQELAEEAMRASELDYPRWSA